MRLTSRFALVAAGLAVATLLTACSNPAQTGNEGDASSKKDKVNIGAVMFARDIEYWQLVEAGMKAAAKESKVSISVQASDRDLATEAALIDQMKVRGVNTLVISPLDADASTATLMKAKNAGMTIMQYNTKVNSDDSDLQHFVGVDNATLGKASGEAAVEYIRSELDGKAKIALMTGGTTTTGPVRRKAFTDAVGTLPGVEVVTEAEAETPEIGAQAFRTILQAHPDVDLVWAWNGSALAGAAAVAGKANSSIKIVGVDMSEQVANIMSTSDSPILAVADQHSYDVGYQAVVNAVKLAQGKSVPAAQEVKPVVYEAGDKEQLQMFRDELAKASK